MKDATITTTSLFLAARLALAFLWIFTGLTSVFFSPQTGYDILAQAGITGTLAHIAVYGGACLDIAIGLWLLGRWQLKACCIIQIAIIVIYTLLLTMIDASYWLHPFGPITKNIPVIVLILFIMVEQPQKH